MSMSPLLFPAAIELLIEHPTAVKPVVSDLLPHPAVIERLPHGHHTLQLASPKRQSDPSIWYTNLRSSDHFSPHRNLFTTFHKFDKSMVIYTAEGTAIGTGTGNITLTLLWKDDVETELQFNNVIYEFKPILPHGGIRPRVRDTWIRPQNLSQRYDYRQAGTRARRTLPPQEYNGFLAQTTVTPPELDVNIWHTRLAHLGEDNVIK